MPKIVVWHHCYLALKSRSKVGVKVIAQGQRSRSNFRRAVVDIRGSAKVCLCVCNQGAYTDTSADAVDRRFNIIIYFHWFWLCASAYMTLRWFLGMSHLRNTLLTKQPLKMFSKLWDYDEITALEIVLPPQKTLTFIALFALESIVLAAFTSACLIVSGWTHLTEEVSTFWLCTCFSWPFFWALANAFIYIKRSTIFTL